MRSLAPIRTDAFSASSDRATTRSCAVRKDCSSSIHWRAKQLIQQVNERVALQSRKYVYGYSDAHLSFVTSRLGSAWTADPLEDLPLDVPKRPVADLAIPV
jgi:hypothetical protein